MSRTILIVDDDPLVKMTLRSFFEERTLGFILLVSVSNGQEALDFLEKQFVDIVISDLVMPVMGGLDLIRELKNRDYRGLILVLSNYSDFSMVREALLLGAADYLLKTDLKREDLLERLETLSVRFASEASQILRYSSIDTKFQISLFKDFLLTSDFLSDRFLEEAPMIQEVFEGSMKVCLLSCVEDMRRSSLPMDKLQGMIETVYESLPSLIIFRIGKNELVWFLPDERDGTKGNSTELSLKLIKRQALIYFSINAALLYSPSRIGAEAVRGEFRLLSNKTQILFYGQIGVFAASEIIFSSLPPDWSSRAFALLLSRTFKEGGPDLVRDELNWRMAFCSKEKVAPTEVKQFLLGALEYIGFTEKKKPDLLNTGEQAEDCAAMFLAEVLRLFSTEVENPTLVNNKEIQRVLKYINDNYRTRILLEDLASLANLNRSYLCRLFKKETGHSVVEYITWLRVERARTLMDEGYSYVKEIAEKVGFDDQFYFTRVFKKTLGISPSDYLKGR